MVGEISPAGTMVKPPTLELAIIISGEETSSGWAAGEDMAIKAKEKVATANDNMFLHNEVNGMYFSLPLTGKIERTMLASGTR